MNFNKMLDPVRAAASRLICLRLDRILKYAVLLSPTKQVGPEAVSCYYFLSLVAMKSASAGTEEAPQTAASTQDSKQQEKKGIGLLKRPKITLSSKQPD